MSDWISVKDRLPERGTACLVYRIQDVPQNARVIVAAYRAGYGGVWSSVPGLYNVSVTHWMPLPALPASEPAPGETEV